MSRKPTLGGRLVLSLFMMGLILFGVSMLIGAVRELQESREAMSWPTARGQIVRSEMKTHTQEVRRQSDSGIHRTVSEDFYSAEIEYEFEVEGVTHKGTRRSAVQGGDRSDRPHVQETLARYPVGHPVTVSYNPSDPSRCVIEPGSSGGFLVWAGLSLFLIAFPLGMIWVAWHPKYSQVITGL